MNMQDPMSLMAAAQRLTITQLQQSIRNGTIDPQIGQLVLNSKINEDKRSKAAMAAQVAAQPPVTQQNLAYGAGVDGLPSNLPVQGMAGGGIVSFEKGGLADYTQAEFDALPPETQQMLLDRAGIVGGLNKLVAATKDLATLPGRGIMGAAETAITRPLRALGVPIPYLPDAAYGGDRASMTPYFDKLRAAENKANEAAKPKATTKPSLTTPAINDPSYNLTPTESDYSRLVGGDREAGGDSTARGSQGSQGIGAFNKGYQLTPFTEAQKQLEAALAAENNPATGKPFTYAEKAAERKAQQEAEGIDFGLYKKQQAELEGKKGLSESRSRLNEATPYFKFAELLSQAPKAGETTATAFSRALSGAGGAKAEIMDKEEARQEKIRSESFALALAQNQFNAAQFSGNEGAMKEAKAAERAARKDLTGLNVKGVEAQNEVAKEVFKAESDMARTKVSAAASMYSADKAQNTINGIIATLMKDNPTMSKSEATKRAYEISNPGFGATAQRDLASQRKTLVDSLASYKNVFTPEAKAKRTEIEGMIKMLDNIAGSAGAPAGTPVDFSKLPKG